MCYFKQSAAACKDSVLYHSSTALMWFTWTQQPHPLWPLDTLYHNSLGFITGDSFRSLYPLCKRKTLPLVYWQTVSSMHSYILSLLKTRMIVICIVSTEVFSMWLWSLAKCFCNQLRFKLDILILGIVPVTYNVAHGHTHLVVYAAMNYPIS